MTPNRRATAPLTYKALMCRDELHFVSAWRISTGRLDSGLQNRVVYRADQSPDDDLPVLAPDSIKGVDRRSCPDDYRQHAF